MNEIRPADVIQWQNEIMKLKKNNGEAYSPTYLKTIHSQLSAILNHAVNMYDLKDNVARKAGSMGKEESKKILYWTGIREGELLALTPADFDFVKKTLHINKSYQRLEALAKQGFKGGSRGDTEWSQWVQSEKEQLSAVMEQHGIEWEHKGTHEKHLSVLDYKKQEREKEVVQLEGQILEKKEEFQILSDRVENYDNGIENLKTLEQVLDTSPEYQLPEPQGLMSAKTYKNKLAETLVQKAEIAC